MHSVATHHGRWRIMSEPALVAMMAVAACKKAARLLLLAPITAHIMSRRPDDWTGIMVSALLHPCTFSTDAMQIARHGGWSKPNAGHAASVKRIDGMHTNTETCCGAPHVSCEAGVVPCSSTTDRKLERPELLTQEAYWPAAP